MIHVPFTASHTDRIGTRKLSRLVVDRCVANPWLRLTQRLSASLRFVLSADTNNSAALTTVVGVAFAASIQASCSDSLRDNSANSHGQRSGKNNAIMFRKTLVDSLMIFVQNL
jgi:hypothetical protein